MLLHPGEAFDFDGTRLTYPDIRLVYWCGGNPFHHHQHLARLRQALARPATIVVHDSFWTPMARHADIVLPATMTLERNDIGGSSHDACLIAMRQAVEPWGEARSDFAIFADLAAALGVGERFTEGRDEMAWLRHLYEGWRVAGLPLLGAALRRILERRIPRDTRRRRGPRAVQAVPRRPRALTARHAEREDRDILRDHRRIRLRGLPRASDVASANGMAGGGAGRALSPPPRREQSDSAPAQPARRGRLQPVDQGARARAHPGSPSRCRGPRAFGAATRCACSTTAGAVSPARW